VSRLLVVTADDYGLTPGVSQGVLDCHVQGIVTATSVLAVAPAASTTLPWLVDHPTLEVGLHLAAVGEDPPLLAASEIPTLVDQRGRLAPSWRHLAGRLLRRAVDPDDLRREWSAQRDLVVGAGLRLTHLNAHQHVQLWPAVGRLVAELARAWDVPYVRLPTADPRRPAAAVVRPLVRRLQRTLAEAGRTHSGRTVGVAGAGRMDQSRLLAELARLRDEDRVVELVSHPGMADDPDRRRYRWGYRWDAERAALCSPATRDAVDRSGRALVGPSAVSR